MIKVEYFLNSTGRESDYERTTGLPMVLWLMEYAGMIGVALATDVDTPRAVVFPLFVTHLGVHDEIKGG